MTIQELINKSVDKALLSGRKTDKNEIKHDIEDLILFALKIKYETLFLKKRIQIDEISERIFNNAFKEYMNYKPLAYIIHNSVFYNYNFFVNESCLIPRVDSEILVTQAIKFIKQKTTAESKKQERYYGNIGKKDDNVITKIINFFKKNISLCHCKYRHIKDNIVYKINNNTGINKNDLKRDANYVNNKIKVPRTLKILDACCGSGCLGLSLVKTLFCKYNFRQDEIELTLMDISSSAMQVAYLNAQRFGVKVKCIIGDVLCGFGDKIYDIIICNPPYIETDTIEKLDKEVKNFEPHLALDGGKDGLKFYHAISRNIAKNLSLNGQAFFEIGYNQATSVGKIFNDNGFQTRILKDYGKQDRVLILKQQEKEKN